MNLTRREKTVVFGGLSVLVVLLAVQFLVRPALDRMSTLRRIIASKQQELAELNAKSFNYKQIEIEVRKLRFTVDQQDQGPSILAAVEYVRQASGLSDNILSLRPISVALDERYQETVVEIQLQGVTMAQLVQLLSRLESVDFPGGIKSLDIRRAQQDSDGLRVNVQVAAVSRAGDSPEH